MEYEDEVRAEWIDENDHMNLAYYVLVFTRATEAFAVRLGLAGGRVTQLHTAYEREVTRGDRLRVVTHVLDISDCELHLLHEMFQADESYRAACLEMVLSHRGELPAEARSQLLAIVARPRPPAAGRRIAMARTSRDT